MKVDIDYAIACLICGGILRDKEADKELRVFIIKQLEELKSLREQKSNWLLGYDTSRDLFYYNKAIDDFAKTIKPYIAQYRSAIEHNRYAFIDVNNIAEHLKEGGVNED